MDYQSWRHVFKLDPAKKISDEHLERLCESGTDAILIGGNDDVTLENVLELMARVRRFSLPAVLEISSIDSVTPGFDFYFIPTVLNSTNPKWIKGLHQEAIREYGDLMDWEELVPEGYCILNPDCKAAKLTDADTSLDTEDVVAYARLAEHFFKLPIFYLEYSGTYGDPELIEEIKGHLSSTRLYYGGGIDTAERAREMARFADTVVVGNVIYTDIEQAIRTVKAVAETMDQSL